MFALLNRSRLIVAGLAIVALVLGTLIYRDMFVSPKNAANALNLYTVARRTVTASVTGSGNVEPQQQANVNFKVAGTLTNIYVTVGDHVTAGQTLASIDSTAEQTALDQAQANLATAEANLQSVETPLTQNQITQLQDAVNMAQQTYNDTVAQVNLTNSQDAAQVTADQNQLTLDQSILNNSLTYQQDKQQLATDQATLQAAETTFKNDATCTGVAFANYSAQCLAEFTAVSNAQTAVTLDQAKVNNDALAVNNDQAKLNADTIKQTNDKTSGQRSINQAAASLTSAQDQLKTQTESKPNQIASAKANVLSAQAAVATAQQNLGYTTLVAPMDGEVNSINGVVGETVAPGGGATAEAPGSQAPLPTTTGSSAFMVIGNVSGLEVVIPFAESDASRLSFNDDAHVTFDAVPNLAISGHVIAVGSAATVTSGVVNYYATIVLNQTDKSLKQGMTANATVTVSKSANALTVPNLAITHAGGQAFVTVYANGQQVETPIDTGVVGDQYTEVVGGLNDGEQIVLPTIRAATGTGTTRGGFGGGGGGGIRVGGGG
ncbi:MAG TPA: biotin/lipoyl-binding protein [Candidatus Dormibacteraeota bacterium]|nr:biotin/lipoyl-binding protein [Candidatus Dormibacteraeota bacterium]